MCAQPSGSHRAAQVKAAAPLPGMHQISQLHGHDQWWREMVRHLRTNSHQRRADPCGPAGGEAAERRRRVRAEARASGATSGRTILRASTPQGLQVSRECRPRPGSAARAGWIPGRRACAAGSWLCPRAKDAPRRPKPRCRVASLNLCGQRGVRSSPSPSSQGTKYGCIYVICCQGTVGRVRLQHNHAKRGFERSRRLRASAC
jgi:hypothetical protein